MGSSPTRGAGTCPRSTTRAGEPRALRADRFGSVRLGGAGRPPDAGFDAVAFVSRTLARVPWTFEVEVVLHVGVERALERFPPTLAELEPLGDDALLRMRAESLDWVAGLLAGSGFGFSVRRPEALRDSVRAVAERLRTAAG